jgi:hypothetical protein
LEARTTTRVLAPVFTVTLARRRAVAASAWRPAGVARRLAHSRAALTSPGSEIAVRFHDPMPAASVRASLRARQRSAPATSLVPSSATERLTREQPRRAALRSASRAAIARSANVASYAA